MQYWLNNFIDVFLEAICNSVDLFDHTSDKGNGSLSCWEVFLSLIIFDVFVIILLVL